MCVDICADLQREQDDGEADDCSDAHSYDDRLGVVETGDHAHHIGEAQRQNGLQEEKKKFCSQTENVTTLCH